MNRVQRFLFACFLMTSALAASAKSGGKPVVSAPLTTSTVTSMSPTTPAPTAQALALDIPELSLEKGDGRSLNLEDCIRLAIDGASEVLKAENDLHFSGARLFQAYGQFLPNLTGQASYGYSNGNSYSTAATPVFVSGAGNSAGYTVMADLNLFNGLSDFATFKSALQKDDASELTVKRVKQKISLDVAQAFLQVILDDKLVNIAKKNLQASQERERLLQEQTDVGSKNLSDLFREQAQLSIDESAVFIAQNKIRADQIKLLRRLRLDINKNYHFVEPNLNEEFKKTKLPSESDLIARALELRMDLKASDLVANATKWDVRQAASGYLPKLDFQAAAISGGHTLYTQTVNGVNMVPSSQPSIGNQLGTQIDYTVGLSLSWNIFDRFVTKENVAQAHKTAADAAIDAYDRRLEVQGDVRQAYGDYLTAIQLLKSAKKGSEAAQKAFEVMDGRYDVGAASFLDLITAQIVLVQSESTRAQALINFQLQDKSLSYAVGDLSTQ